MIEMAPAALILPRALLVRCSALLLAVFGLAVFGLGCGAVTQSFVPVSGVRVAGPYGPYTAAEVDLHGDAQRGGEVRVWSRGAFRDAVEGQATTVVHVGFALENRGSVPLQLDAQRLFLEDVALADGTLDRVVPAHLDGNAPVPPSGIGHIDAYFTLPRGIWPDAVQGYRVAWLVQGEGRSFSERTAFQSARPWGWAAYYEYPGPWGWYGRAYPPYFYTPYYYWGAPSVRSRVYGPRVLARPRLR